MGEIECAGAVVRDDAGRLLLVRRGHEPAIGTWSLPGGRVEPGETHAVAAAREVREETGMTVEVGNLIDTIEVSEYRIRDFHATVTGGALRAGDDAADARWLTPSEIEALDTSPGLVDWLRRMRIL